MINYLVFDTDEKKLIFAALKLREKIISGDRDFETYLYNIQEEVSKENVFLSRSQLDSIQNYLGSLLDYKDEYDQAAVIDLENKIDAIIELP